MSMHAKQGWDGQYQLRHADTMRLVRPGDRVRSFRDELYKVNLGTGEPPQHEASSGKVWVRPADSQNESNCMELYPSVFGLKWVKVQSEWLPDCGSWVEQSKFVC